VIVKEAYQEWYRYWIYGRGQEHGVKEDGAAVKVRFDEEVVKKVLESEGQIPSAEQLTRTVRHFSEGLVLGTGALLTAVFEAQRAYFGPKRKSGPRKIRGRVD
jgi:hypothetical protein